jgi:Nuclease-related domain/AAA domain/UvrD-like helicase C-terminal domain
VAIFPQGLSQIDARCDAGERRVLQQLKRCLEDDYLVWHNVPIGPKARQPDFVILSPRCGLLILEVKHWRLGTLRGATRDLVVLDRNGERITAANPLRQARDYTLELVDLMQRDRALVHAAGPFSGKLLFPYGHGAVFSNIRTQEVLGTDFGAVFADHRTLLRDDLDGTVEPEAFQRRLSGLFTVHYPYTLSLPQRDRVRWHLFPDVRIHAQASLDFEGGADAAAPPLPDLLHVMDLQQQQIARTLGEGHRVIHGAAGSGKTMILVFRAQHLMPSARPDRPILVLCFNRALCDRIDAMLRQRGADERVQVRTFHSWCSDMVKTYQLAVPPQADRHAYYAAMAASVERAIERKQVPAGQYTALLIDEAHDFEDAWLRMASRMVAPQTNSLLVLYDDAQSIYQPKRRKFNFASVGIEARGRTSILRLNYRNTAEVMALAVHCARQLLEGASGEPPASDDDMPLVQPATAGRRGPMPVLLQGRDEGEEAELVAERIAQAYSEGVALDEVAVLAGARYLLEPVARALHKRRLAVQSMSTRKVHEFDWARPGVKLLTMHSAKGLEFPHVFVVGLQAMPLRHDTEETALRLLYVAMTRATHGLVLSCHGDSPIVARTREALRGVTEAMQNRVIGEALEPSRYGRAS